MLARKTVRQIARIVAERAVMRNACGPRRRPRWRHAERQNDEIREYGLALRELRRQRLRAVALLDVRHLAE
jgi:hypothetical protein